MIIYETHCDKYFPLKKSDSIEKDIQKISSDSFEYFNVNETTYTCDCLQKQRKAKCYSEFDNLRKKYAKPLR